MQSITSEQNQILKLIRDDSLRHDLVGDGSLCTLKDDRLRDDEVCFYKVKRLTFDEEYPHREAFENVLQTQDNEAFNFVYILDGSARGIELYLGVVRNHNPNRAVLGKKLNAVDQGRILSGVFEGNFGGSVLERLKGARLDDVIFDTPRKFRNAGVIVGIPSLDDADVRDDAPGFQGIDRLINSMLGLRWRLAIVCEPVSEREIDDVRDNIYRVYDELSRYAQRSIQQSTSRSVTANQGQSSSSSKGASRSDSKSDTTSRGRQSSSTNSGESHQTGETFGESTTNTDGTSSNVGINVGNSSAVTIELVNKRCQEMLKYIDEELLERIKRGAGRGLFKTSIYYMGDKPSDADRLKAGIISLFQGSGSTYSTLRACSLDVEREPRLLTSYQNFYVGGREVMPERLTLLSRPHLDGRIGLNTYLTTREISLTAGLPQREVPGIVVKAGVEFGLNFERAEHALELGSLILKGRVLRDNPASLNADVLDKHIFVAGVTGSGKTTTCHKLLREARRPFLVLEPAKTEYREFINHFDDVAVFTVGDESTAPLRLNPFELVGGENVSAHIDMLKATFVSSFPMEASMPQLIEEALCKIYEDKGWNFDGDPPDEETLRAEEFPTLDDFLCALDAIVDTKGFSDRLRDDYRGSLVSRFSNLTKGSKGALLNCRRSVNFDRLLDRNVIIEMENLKSAEDKALVMGFILTRLEAAIKHRHALDNNYRHITLIEEAHRLLSRVEYGAGGLKRTAVETFTDMLAEIRKYGESLIVVDQIPNKLAPEVLKNTNTKIIHRLFARDDKEAVGDTMLMDDRQKEYLSALEIGQAIVFSEGMSRPIHVQIDAATDTGGVEVSNDEVRRRFKRHFGGQYRSMELTRRFYRPLEALLRSFAEEYITSGRLSTETILRAERFIAEVNQYEASGDDDLTVEYLSTEYCRRHGRDRLFRRRLESFLERLLSNDEAPIDYEAYRLLDDIRTPRVGEE